MTWAAAASTAVQSGGGPAGSAVAGRYNRKGAKKQYERSKKITIQAQRWSAKQADRARNFAERMSNTSYQRATQDLEKAGLNRILAYTQGGASQPSSAQASASSQGAPDTSKRGSDAVNSGAMVANMIATTRAVNAQTQLTGEKTKEQRFKNTREELMSNLWEQVLGGTNSAMGAVDDAIIRAWTGRKKPDPRPGAKFFITEDVKKAHKFPTPSKTNRSGSSGTRWRDTYRR